MSTYLIENSINVAATFSLFLSQLPNALLQNCYIINFSATLFPEKPALFKVPPDKDFHVNASLFPLLIPSETHPSKWSILSDGGQKMQSAIIKEKTEKTNIMLDLQ